MIKVHCDVLVVGGGPAGISASISSARMGAKTVLVERYGIVGGGLTSQYVRPLMGWVKNKNLGNEIEENLSRYKDFTSPVESAKCVLAEMLNDAKVQVYLQTQIVKVERRGEKIICCYGVFHGKEYQFIASQYIDASGDGDLSYLANCKIEIGREDGLVQPLSIMFTIDGVDKNQTLMCGHEEHYTTLSNGKEYLDLCHKACASGELPPSVNIVRLYDIGKEGERMVNATQLNKIDPLNPTQTFTAEVELRKQIIQVVKFLKNNIPGFENIRVTGSAYTMGVRESRRVIGDYVLCGQDLIEGKQFNDAIVHKANFPIDIHNPDGAGQAETDGVPHTAKDYDIPYRCLTPLGVSNLLTCGRIISGTHRAHASYRVMRICLATGNAAGVASVLALKSGNTRDIDMLFLQKKLNIYK